MSSIIDGVNKADQIIESGTLSKWLTQAKDFFCKMTKYFGTDGIRGAYGAKLINEDFVRKLDLPSENL